MVLALAIELYLHLHIVQKPERHLGVTSTAVMLTGTPVSSCRNVVFAAGPIPTIQELEAQEARDADADSIFGEADAPAAGVMQQSDCCYIPANHTLASGSLFQRACANVLLISAAQLLYGFIVFQYCVDPHHSCTSCLSIDKIPLALQKMHLRRPQFQ